MASYSSKEAEQAELEKRIAALEGVANTSSNNAQSESPSSDKEAEQAERHKRIAALQDVDMSSSELVQSEASSSNKEAEQAELDKRIAALQQEMVSTKDSPDPDKEIKTFLASKIEDLDNWKSDERTEQKFQ